MKNIFLLSIIMLSFNIGNTQVNISKSYATNNIEKLKLTFDYPQLVKVKTWNKNQVTIEAKVNINDGLNNDAFVITETTDDNVLRVEGKIKKVEDLPRKTTVFLKDKTITFRNNDEFKKYKKENNLSNNINCNNDIDIEIEVTIYVPEKLATEVTSTYGLIEIVNFAAPLKATSPYKGIDVVILKENIGKLSASTSYGEILTDINFDIEEKESRDFYTYFKANVGSGYSYNLSSTYGKLYLRKKT